MNREEIIAKVREQMPPQRWNHVYGVMQTAVRLAERYGADPERAELAAILHDLAKFWPVETLQRIARDMPMPEPFVTDDVLQYDVELLHAPVGAYVAETEYGIHDQEVLDAIRYHTTGRENMTLIEKVVCLADYIEPGRDFPGVNEIREIAEINLEEALIAGFDSVVRYLQSINKVIYPLTYKARENLIQAHKMVKEAIE